MMKLTMKVAVIALITVLMTAGLTAGTITGTSFVTTTEIVGVSQNDGGWRNLRAGLFDITYSNNTTTLDFLRDNPAANGNQFLAFCIEIEQTLANSIYDQKDLSLGKTSNPNSPIGPARAGALEAAFASFFGTTGIDRGRTATEYAAMQIVIWEIVYEAAPAAAGNWAYDLTSGNIKFQNNAAALTQATTWINTINDSATRLSLTNSELFALNNGGLTSGNQDLVVQVLQPSVEEVPEPGTLGLLGFGLLALGYVRKRVTA